MSDFLYFLSIWFLAHILDAFKPNYHYVGIQLRNGKFDSYRANTTINGKSTGMGTSKNEIECALMADAYLDEYEANNPTAKKRPKNRDDFPEVGEAFIAKAEATKVIDAMAEAKEEATTTTGGSSW